MRFGHVVAAIAVSGGLSTPALAQTPQEQARQIIQTMSQKHVERAKGVAGYIVDLQNTNRAILYFQKNANDVGFRQLPPAAIQEWLENQAGLTAQDKKRISQGVLGGGIAIGQLSMNDDLPVLFQAMVVDVYLATAEFLTAANDVKGQVRRRSTKS